MVGTDVTVPASLELATTLEAALPTQAMPGEQSIAELGPEALPASLIQPGDLRYLGAFRLPDDQPFETGWAWSSEAIAFRPDGYPDGPVVGIPGSIFGAGHNWNQFVAEIDIPIPVYSAEKDLSFLNTDLWLVSGFQPLQRNSPVLLPQ